MELANQAQILNYQEYIKFQGIIINALDTKTLERFFLTEDLFRGSEERMNKSNKYSNSFPVLDLGI